MLERVRRIDQEVNRIEKREDEKNQLTTLHVDLWLGSGSEDGGILVINDDLNTRMNIASTLRIRNYLVREASGYQEVISALQKASYNLMIVPWTIFERSGDFVNLLRKAFPFTKFIITSPSFAWSSENIVGFNHGKDALNAGAYSYIPDRHIFTSLWNCVESAMKTQEKSCPVLLAGLPCNLVCKL